MISGMAVIIKGWNSAMKYISKDRPDK